MILSEYLKLYNISRTSFARLINVSRVSASRYASETRLPPREAIISIYKVTGGQVTPNDFYNLPDLSAELLE